VKGALRLAAVDAAALSGGIAPGMTLADARARRPDLRVAEMDASRDAALLLRLADASDRYTPLVALDPPHGLMLDISGCAHLFGGEAELRADLLRRCAAAGLDARASIAGTPEAARALVRFGGCAIARPGGEAEAVEPLPAAALGLAPDIAVALSRAGLKTIGDLAARAFPPPNAGGHISGARAPLAARFGEDLLRRLGRALGRENIGMTPRRPLPSLSVEKRFAEPIGRMEDVVAALELLAAEAARALEERGMGGRVFEAGFFRTDGHVARLDVGTGRPIRDPARILRLFRERMEGLAEPLDAGFGYDLVRLGVLAAEALSPAQAGLAERDIGWSSPPHLLRHDERISPPMFGYVPRLDRGTCSAGWPGQAGPRSKNGGLQDHEDDLADLIDRLSARFGEDAVRSFVAEDAHVPEHAARTRAAIRHSAQGAWEEPEAGEPPARPVHLFDPPQAVEAVAGVPDGPPLRFRWRRVLHEVAKAEGPERIAPEWWSGQGASPTRDYYRVEDSEGRRFWLFRDGLYGEMKEPPRWWLHGLFA
jgi:protein ImuB